MLFRSQFSHSLGKSFDVDTTLLGGVDSRLGAYFDATVLAPVTDGLRLGGGAGLYSRRGLLIGPAADYTRDDETRGVQGTLRSGYVNDHGDKRTDRLGQPVPEDRAFVTWEHQQTLADNLALTAQLNWWRDSEVLRDFRPREFFPVQAPDTFAEATYAGKNFFVSLFARPRPNNFERVQERLRTHVLDSGVKQRSHISSLWGLERRSVSSEVPNYGSMAAIPEPAHIGDSTHVEACGQGRRGDRGIQGHRCGDRQGAGTGWRRCGGELRVQQGRGRFGRPGDHRSRRPGGSCPRPRCLAEKEIRELGGQFGRALEVEFRAAAFGRSTTYTLRYDYTRAPERLRWHQTAGDLTDTLQGQ